MSDREHYRPLSADGVTSDWPGGWYIYENGRVQGPFSAEATFNVTDGSQPGTSQRLVSRKGFSQWYPHGELAELYKLADKIGHKTTQEVEKLEAQISENLANLELLRALVQTGADPSVIAKTPMSPAVGVVAKVLETSAQPSAARASQVSKSKPVTLDLGANAMPSPSIAAKESSVLPAQSQTQKIKRLSRKEKKALARAKATQNPTPKPSQVASQASPTPSQSTARLANTGSARSLSIRSALMQEYLVLRGRLRLGELRSPWFSAALLFPVSLGTYWGMWYSDTARELNWHIRNATESPHMPPMWLAWIPVIHIYMAYRLGKLVLEMEIQNGYRTTSPLLAAIFSVIPPFGMAYLQDAVNQHWWLHVKHSMVAKAK